MARKRSEIQPISPDAPIYPIGVAARMLNVHPRTLRIYETEGFIGPAHVGSRRMFSANDIQWITCLRTLIHKEGISIPGLKKFLEYAPCWELKGCPPAIHEHCGGLVDIAPPRVPHKVGDAAALKAAKETQKEKRQTGSQKKSAVLLAEYGSKKATGYGRSEATVIWLNSYRCSFLPVDSVACG